VNPHISVITIGVSDLGRAKQFYGEGLGWPIAVDQGQFVSFAPAAGSSGLALYPMQALAGDAGVDSEGSGFRGITFNYFVRSDDRVDTVLADAERAGATILKPAERAKWGGYSGHFADPDGYIWKVVVGSEGQAFSE
jgi:predicted enzyme related to lactoylglutathione lyase